MGWSNFIRNKILEMASSSLSLSNEKAKMVAVKIEENLEQGNFNEVNPGILQAIYDEETGEIVKQGMVILKINNTDKTIEEKLVNISEEALAAPAMKDGFLCVVTDAGNNKSNVHFITKDGSVKWKVKLDGKALAAPAMKDGFLCVVTDAGNNASNVHFIAKDGSVKFKKEVKNIITSYCDGEKLCFLIKQSDENLSFVLF